jgi:PPM family protein phosphatase
MKLTGYGRTDAGLVRKNNEDYYLIDPELSLFVVCDGLGGHASGEVASETCARTMQKYVQEHRAAIAAYLADRSPRNRGQVGAALVAAVQLANQKIHQQQLSDPSKKGMATTVAAMLVAHDYALLAHVGDSRIYLHRAGKVHLLTEDHKVATEMKRQGVWTADEAANSPYADVLTRAVGGQEFVQVDLLELELVPGDMFLLCSDGLHRYFKGGEVTQAGLKKKPMQIPDEFVTWAREQGGVDNVTAVVVKVHEDERMAAAVDVLKRSELLGKIPLFRYLSYTELMKVLSLVDLRTFEKGDTLIQEGSTGEEMFLLAQGLVNVVKADQVLTKIKKGEMFGEMSLFDSAKRSASIVAAEKTVAMVIARKELMPLLRREAQLAVKLLWALTQELNQRLRNSTKDLADAKAQLGSLLPAVSPAQSPNTEVPFEIVIDPS